VLKQGIFCILVLILCATALSAFASPYTMKGPPRGLTKLPDNSAQSVPSPGGILLGAINFYRRVISPIQGGRCGFYPSCSTYGMHAVQHYGALQGGMMTADRLTRCNIFKKPGFDYYLRPDGRLYDPFEANLLKEL
jgi:putative membrane protein insertion efficiency factor